MLICVGVGLGRRVRFVDSVVRRTSTKPETHNITYRIEHAVYRIQYIEIELQSSRCHGIQPMHAAMPGQYTWRDAQLL